MAPQEATATAAQPAAPAAAPEPKAQPAPKPEMPRGVVPRDAAKALFAALDAQAEGQPAEGTPKAAEEAPPKALEASVERTIEQAETPKEAAAAEAAQEEQLPTKFREAIRVIPDAKIRKQIAVDHFRLRKWDRFQQKLGGVSVEDLDQYVTTAVQIAPTVEVLGEIAETAKAAQELANGFAGGSLEGFGKFAAAMLQANPEAFVDFFGFLTGNETLVAQGLAQNFHPSLAQKFKTYRDFFGDRLNRNVIANMREDSKQEGREVLAEAADVLEEYLGLKGKEKQPTRVAARQPDERDLELGRLRAERQQAWNERVEGFNNRVFTAIGTTLAPEVNAYIDQKLPGLSATARSKHAVRLAEIIYEELLNNPFVKSRAERINAGWTLDEQHFANLANFYIAQGRKFIPADGGKLLQELRESTEPAVQKRTARVEQQMTRRDVGASGKPPGPAKPDLKSIEPMRRSKTPFKPMFDALDDQAEGG
jgi:hypothetical protein